jgi:hypothetical protein
MTKGTNNDSQAVYLHFYSIHGAGPDARRDEEARPGRNKGPVSKPNAHATGNASFLIEARRKTR